MRTDSERKFVCLRRPNPARKSRGARLEVQMFLLFVLYKMSVLML